VENNLDAILFEGQIGDKERLILNALSSMKPRVPILVDRNKNSHLSEKLNIMYGVHCIDYSDIVGQAKLVLKKDSVKLIQTYNEIVNWINHILDI